MGTFSITIGTTASPRTRTKTISDSDLVNRLIPAMRWFFRNVEGSESWTNNQLLDAYFDRAQGELTAITKTYEREQARVAAEQGVTDMPMT